MLITKVSKEVSDELSKQSKEFKVAHVVMTPEQIYDYMHEERTPYSNMTDEEGKAHICGLIERYAERYHDKLLFPLTDDGEIKE